MCKYVWWALPVGYIAYEIYNKSKEYEQRKQTKFTSIRISDSTPPYVRNIRHYDFDAEHPCVEDMVYLFHFDLLGDDETQRRLHTMLRELIDTCYEYESLTHLVLQVGTFEAVIRLKRYNQVDKYAFLRLKKEKKEEEEDNKKEE